MHPQEIVVAGRRRLEQLDAESGPADALVQPPVLVHRETMALRQRQHEAVAVVGLHAAPAGEAPTQLSR